MFKLEIIKIKIYESKNMKTNQRGFTHNIALLVLGVFVLAAVGFAGLRVYQKNNNVLAHAAGGAYLINSGGITLQACRWKNSPGDYSFWLLNRSGKALYVVTSSTKGFNLANGKGWGMATTKQLTVYAGSIRVFINSTTTTTTCESVL